MSKNLLTKFRVFWRSLTPLERERMWEIMTALRGEDYTQYDSDAMRIKEQTTARIRGELFGVRLSQEINSAKGVFIYPKRRTSPSNYQVNLFTTRRGSHFRGHIKSAIRALKPYVKKGKMDDLLKFDNGLAI